MPVSPARKIAFDVLRQVASENAYASDLLFARLEARASQPNAALATELTLGVLRWQGLLDFLLQRHLDRPIARLDTDILLALRLGLYQLRFLDRVPAHAAINESVELAKLVRKRSAASLVNAVLRRAATEAKISGSNLAKVIDAERFDHSENDEAQQLAILHSHPRWLIDRWLVNFGSERTVSLLEANNCPARLFCSLADENGETSIVKSLRADGLEAAHGRWLRSALMISGGNPGAARAFREGKISFQDEASQMVAHLLDARVGNHHRYESVLDLCSAPGGKTAILARAVAPAGRVLACDLHPHRLRATSRQLARMDIQNVDLLALDAAQALPFQRPFTWILLDAPCSGTGTLARNPEIRWRLQPADLLEAHAKQVAMLRNALSALAPGGRLVYATCSLEPEENEQVIREGLQGDSRFQTVSGLSALAPYLRDAQNAGSLFDTRGFFRTFPPETGTDGFFAAVIERAK